MLCQNFRFAGSDLQSTVNPLDIENKGMIRRICGVNFDFVLPCPIRGNKAIVHQMLCIQTHCDRFFQRIVTPQIITALLEANRGIIAIVSGAVYASKSGGVVSAMLSAFQPFDGRMIDDLNRLAEVALNFLFETAAAFPSTAYKRTFSYVYLIAAVAAAMPVYRASSAPFFRGKKSNQTAETPVGYIQTHVCVELAQATAASA